MDFPTTYKTTYRERWQILRRPIRDKRSHRPQMSKKQITAYPEEIMKKLLLSTATLLIILPHLLSVAQQQATTVTVKAVPEHPYVEKGDFGQYLNFDLWVDNPTTDNLRLFRLEASAFDDS